MSNSKTLPFTFIESGGERILDAILKKISFADEKVERPFHGNLEIRRLLAGKKVVG